MMHGDDDEALAPNAAKPQSGAGLKARQRVIGAGLKRLYDDVVEESVPDEFMQLLSRLESSQEDGA